jgi:hypothetical protein
MLRACILEHPGSWDQNLPWAEFSYNNSYQESIKMAPFEVLYGRRCRTPLNWIEPGEKVIFGPDLVEEAESIVHQVQENLKAAKSSQETYANKRRQPLEFEDGNYVYLKVSPMKDVKRFGVKGKLAPRYIGPFPILEKYGTMAYKLDLPPSLTGVHNIFHVSQLKKCLKAPVDVVCRRPTSSSVSRSRFRCPVASRAPRRRVGARRMRVEVLMLGVDLPVHLGRRRPRGNPAVPRAGAVRTRSARWLRQSAGPCQAGLRFGVGRLDRPPQGRSSGAVRPWAASGPRGRIYLNFSFRIYFGIP